VSNYAIRFKRGAIIISEGSNISILRQALMVNKKPFPWLKAFLAGLAASVPVMIGLLFRNFEYGLLAGMGGFTYLYVFNIPYAQRAKKLFFVVIGITLASFLGTIAAPYPLAVAILLGVIGATATFIFGALRIIGPSAIFFVLVFAMTTGMPVEPELAPLRAGLVFLGGCLSWVIAMIGWFFNPYGPETGVVKRVYNELANLIAAVGTDSFNEKRHRVMAELNEAESTLVAGHIPWRITDMYKRLYLLKNHANTIFLYVVENFSNEKSGIPPELAEAVRYIAKSIDTDMKHLESYTDIIQPEDVDPKVAQLFTKIFDADAIMNEPASKVNNEIKMSKASIQTVLLGAFDKNSVVFLTSLRFGVVTAIAGIIAYQFEFERSFWVPLSCVAVMSGATIVATYHRAIQRGIGTAIGIIIASLILATHPTGFVIAFFIFLLTFITELFIVKNYGLAAMFFTPNALLMAESTTIGDVSFGYFAQARLIDVFIGSIIGLIGVLLIGRRSASSRLPHLISKTIRSQAQLLFTLFSEQVNGPENGKRELSKMKTNLMSLKTVYNTAAGEIPVDRESIEYYWSVVFWVEQLGFLLENSAKNNYQLKLSEETLARLLYIYESMATAAYREQSPNLLEVPKLERYKSLETGVINLQKSLQKHEVSH